jgi:hypothetical protein
MKNERLKKKKANHIRPFSIKTGKRFDGSGMQSARVKASVFRMETKACDHDDGFTKKKV